MEVSLDPFDWKKPYINSDSVGSPFQPYPYGNFDDQYSPWLGRCAIIKQALFWKPEVSRSPFGQAIPGFIPFTGSLVSSIDSKRMMRLIAQADG
jgi:hypothetical protein